MSEETDRNIIEQAYADGFEVEMSYRGQDSWFLRGPWRKTPSKWNWERYEFRIKQPKTKDLNAKYPLRVHEHE